MVFIRFARVYSNASDTTKRLTVKLPKQGYPYLVHKLRKAFPKFHLSDSELIIKVRCWLENSMQHDIL